MHSSSQESRPEIVLLQVFCQTTLRQAINDASPSTNFHLVVPRVFPAHQCRSIFLRSVHQLQHVRRSSTPNEVQSYARRTTWKLQEQSQSLCRSIQAGVCGWGDRPSGRVRDARQRIISVSAISSLVLIS
ncbi:hypothetical protein K461DRAFT_30469 [Myriangium duriaei CBS 260.36]|uniref:Uncharacterized protein n=1 Tax=Myriangium duriaei CBS 260.36 TaxID=1168546 RepID=A0A9P4JDF8_9PEZI|nr:hypothetical protein K461DRAFT_30469 [Myriangium duriaei CBS 260.36]